MGPSRTVPDQHGLMVTMGRRGSFGDRPVFSLGVSLPTGPLFLAACVQQALILWLPGCTGVPPFLHLDEGAHAGAFPEEIPGSESLAVSRYFPSCPHRWLAGTPVSTPQGTTFPRKASQRHSETKGAVCYLGLLLAVSLWKCLEAIREAASGYTERGCGD